MSAAVWEGLGRFWLMAVAVLELRTLGKYLAKVVNKNVYGYNEEGFNFEEGLNFLLKQDLEEVTHSFWLIILLQIFQTIAMDFISHNKIKSRLLFIDIRYFFPSMDEDKY